jgi:hypothetical protein
MLVIQDGDIFEVFYFGLLKKFLKTERILFKVKLIFELEDCVDFWIEFWIGFGELLMEEGVILKMVENRFKEFVFIRREFVFLLLLFFLWL